MYCWSETVTDLDRQADRLLRRRYGVIEMADERLVRVRLRPYPKLASWLETRLVGQWIHRHWPGNQCWLYYNQPLGFSNFLALSYVVTSREATFSTFRRALCVLDEIARIKRTDAVLCDASNWRISDRLLKRWGWEPHAPRRFCRNYIKRFYGSYPSGPATTRAAACPIEV